jgi:hypothetical protein
VADVVFLNLLGGKHRTRFDSLLSQAFIAESMVPTLPDDKLVSLQMVDHGHCL